VAGMAALFIIAGTPALLVVPAVADDGDSQVSVGAGDGEVHGRLHIKNPGEPRRPSKPKVPAPSTPPSPSTPPIDTCNRLRLVTRPVDCNTPDPVPRAHLGFTPPTSAEVRVALHLPDPAPRIGPDPSRNEWHMLAVGYPVWLWTSAPTTLSATATHEGLTMSLTADWTSTTFDMGDGHQLTCTRTTEYPQHPDRYGTPSPTCGYTYQARSKPGHDYTVTATTHWAVTWATAGRTGTLTTTYTGDRRLAVGELQALIKG